MELRYKEGDLCCSGNAVKEDRRKRTGYHGQCRQMPIALLVLVSLVLGISLLMSGCSGPVSSTLIGDQPPRVVLSDVNGKAITLPNDLKGQVAIVHFWADGCSS